MMLPSQQILQTTPQGGSPFLMGVRGDQAGSFAAAHVPTAQNQAMTAATNAALAGNQQLNTALHQQATAALNFQDGAPDNEVRNQDSQRQKALALLGQYKAAMVEAGAITPRGPDGQLALAVMGRQIRG